VSALRQDLAFRWRITSDSGAVHGLLQRALANQPADWFRSVSPDHFSCYHGDLGRLLGCFRGDGALVAFGALALDLPVVTDLGSLLGVDAATLCVLDGSAVEREWRGHRLHEGAIVERLRHAVALGCSHAAATVAPLNRYSLRGLLLMGFELRRFDFVYGGLPRFVLYRPVIADLIRPHSQEHAGPDQARTWRHPDLSLALDDLAAHRAALADGLVGYDCRQTPQGDGLVDYRRP
jgi:hypothetical protein